MYYQHALYDLAEVAVDLAPAGVESLEDERGGCGVPYQDIECSCPCSSETGKDHRDENAQYGPGAGVFRRSDDECYDG